ncbi:hypothetical protein LNN31_04320 [Acetobacterium wieringae]|jgi:hypothetical protein|uniref:Transposase n=1 Tax=Acetobacterium wieringae TaxID=52694 RepID=A0ABY6HGX0_9FIRM|nr:hypothetical protein [Acetobacterium wieringae]UYO63636.1 hypothetical protein LNN31_04175 [Acetobacterium wieringae]UYO63662.1 hypothetical protein LNN31_04320 [Acetobacterium wieringae]
MSKVKVSKEALIRVVQVYNDEGRSAAYDLLRSQHGIKNPYFIRKRIDGDPRFEYDPDQDRYLINDDVVSEGLFMSIDELCSPAVSQHVQPAEKNLSDTRPADMEKLIQKLLGDRLLELSKYITLESSSKTMILDQTSLKNDGYRLITH